MSPTIVAQLRPADINRWLAQAFVECSIKCTTCRQPVIVDPPPPPRTAPVPPLVEAAAPPKRARVVAQALSVKEEGSSSSSPTSSSSSSSSSSTTVKRRRKGKGAQQKHKAELIAIREKLREAVEEITKSGREYVMSSPLPEDPLPSTLKDTTDRQNENRRLKYKHDLACIEWHKHELEYIANMYSS